MISLSDSQLQILVTAAAAVPVEKRNLFLERIEAALNLCGRFSDGDVDAAVKTATQGLVQRERV